MTAPILFPGVCGVVTVNDWVMTPDGDTAKHFWGPLEVFAEVDLIGFTPKPDAGWYLIVNKRVIIPGCQVRGIFLCDTAPPSRMGVTA